MSAPEPKLWDQPVVRTGIGALLVAMYALAWGQRTLKLAGNGWVDENGMPFGGDFVTFWAASRLALERTPGSFCLTTLPVCVMQDLLWVWPDAESANLAKTTPLPLSPQIPATADADSTDENGSHRTSIIKFWILHIKRILVVING